MIKYVLLGIGIGILICAFIFIYCAFRLNSGDDRDE